MSELFTLRRATVCLVAANNEHRRAPCSHTIVFFGAVKTFKVELRYGKKYNKKQVREKKESFHLKNALQFSIAYIFSREQQQQQILM
jgi:hypothetical protein